MSIRQMLCTNTTKIQFCSTGRNLCTEAEVAIKCNVTLQGALHPSARGNDGAKKLVCVKQHWMKLKKKTWRPLSQDWKGRRSFAHQIFNYACTTVFRTNCNNLDKKHIPLPYLEKKSWRSATWGGGVQPPAYFILCILWCLSQKWFMHELCIKKKKKERKPTNKTPHFLLRVINTLTGHPEKLWNLCLWRYSKPNETWLWATYLTWKAMELDEMISRGVTSMTLWFYTATGKTLKTVENNHIPNFQNLSTWHLILD